MKIVKKWVCLVLALLAVFGGTVGTLARTQQAQLAQKTVRLHVRANSDSEEDQAAKLLVRDAVLCKVQQLTGSCETAEDAVLALSRNLPVLAEAAEKKLRSVNCGAAIRVSLQKEVFPTRVYDTFRLPAGEYPALRVDIGQAAGHNWWCVVFPTLCRSATSESMAQTAEAAGFSDEEIALMTEESPQVRVKFRILEWLTALRGKG